MNEEKMHKIRQSWVKDVAKNMTAGMDPTYLMDVEKVWISMGKPKVAYDTLAEMMRDAIAQGLTEQ